MEGVGGADRPVSAIGGLLVDARGRAWPRARSPAGRRRARAGSWSFGAWPRRAVQPGPYDAELPHSRQPSAAGLQPATRVRSAGRTAVLRLRRSMVAWTTRSSRIRIATLARTTGCAGSRVRGVLKRRSLSCTRESGPGISPRGWCSSPCFSVQPSPLPNRGAFARGSAPPGRAPRYRSTSTGSSWSTSGES